MTHHADNFGRNGLHSRRGGIYAAILGVSLVVFTVSLGAIAAVRAQARAANAADHAAHARRLAASGIELARLIISQNANWRSDRPSGKWVTSQPLGAGAFSVEVVNPFGDLDRSETDPVVITATGAVGAAVQKLRVELEAEVGKPTALRSAIAAGSTITLNSGSTISASGQWLSSNAGISATSATINADAEAVLTCAGSTYNGRLCNGAPARALPSADAFDYYLRRGTAIPVSSLPLNTGIRYLQRVLLSPGNNPYGASNPEGIYIIDCNSENLVIQNLRVVGTLVILNPGAASTLQGSVNFEPAVAGLPCIMIRGVLAMRPVTTLLAENTSPAVNFNPPGTPYPYLTTPNSSNTNMTDTYPSRISGLVYITGNVILANAPVVDRLIVGGTLTVNANAVVTVSGQTDHFTNPPPGFSTINMKVKEGSWARVAD